jgi:hypothetical protein
MQRQAQTLLMLGKHDKANNQSGSGAPTCPSYEEVVKVVYLSLSLSLTSNEYMPLIDDCAKGGLYPRLAHPDYFSTVKGQQSISHTSRII